jgi:subtilisin family serine protease
MEEQDYIVFEVRSTGPGEDEFSFGPSEEAVEQPSTVLDIHSMTPPEAADAKRAPNVVVAEPLPTRLIEPVSESDVSGPLAAGATWGVEAVGATASPFTGNGVKVAVLDTGIDANHPAFAGLTVTEKDFTGEGNGDTNGHGTHCAGTIAGQDVNGTRFGVARGLDELLVGKVLGKRGGSTATIASAMVWALDNGANVLSMSLGIDFPGLVDRLTASGMNLQPATSRALEAYRDNLKLFGAVAEMIAVSGRFGRPAVVVAATGNESERDAAQPYTIGVSPPAASDGFIRVAALRQNGTGELAVAGFSNTGATLAAPGVDVVSAKPGGGLTSKSGTSMATPHVAGVAALWAEKLAADDRFDPELLLGELRGKSRELASLAAVDGGSGLVQAPTG